MSGILYIVATPIGNLKDITLRALDIFREVDVIITEDTRHSRKLLSSFAIQKELISYFEYSKSRKAEAIIERLERGENLALITDAGTPTISDPGARLIALARQKGLQVIPIPGASALTSALSVSGLPTEPLHFWGFLTPKRSKRKKIYDAILCLEGVHCFYESPHKLLKRLDEWEEYFQGYWMFVAKEMTKMFETTWWGKINEVVQELRQVEPRGEYVVLLSKESMFTDKSSV